MTPLAAQEDTIRSFFPDSIYGSASISFYVADLITGEVLTSIDPGRAVAPASVEKLVTTSAALELLGADYRFRTIIGYTGELSRNGKTLTGDIIIKGGGDPTLGSENFPEYYNDIVMKMALAINVAGIKKIKGRIIADESIYGFNPVSSRWSWGDLGNYYGAGAYGLTVFDNTFRIYLRTGDRGSIPEILRTEPEMKEMSIESYLISEGSTDRGYVYSAPYNTHAWITGAVPENRDEFILKASIPDPPLKLATMVREKLESLGIVVSEGAATARTVNNFTAENINTLLDIYSPPLSEIVTKTNHVSVNLYAEHLLKQLGYEIAGTGTTSAGANVVKDFLAANEIPHAGIVIEDGSGLAARNSMTSEFIVSLIRFMLLNGNNPEIFRNSLPAAGEDGTMRSYFRDPLFQGKLRAKTGTLSRVRSYAGVFTAESGRDYAFCIFVNNYTGPLSAVNRNIEELFKYLMINN